MLHLILNTRLLIILFEDNYERASLMEFCRMWNIGRSKWELFFLMRIVNMKRMWWSENDGPEVLRQGVALRPDAVEFGGNELRN